jgi:hypothetical protein
MVLRKEMSEEARKILSYMEGVKPNQQIDHEFLLNLTGINNVPALRPFFYTAADHAFNKWGMKFKAVKGEGYRRLDDSGKNDEVSYKIKIGRRRLGREERLQRSIDFEKLDPVGKLECIVNGMQIREQKEAISRRHRNELAEEVVKNDVMNAAIDGTLALWKRKRA